jgi:hypothetical protein
MADDLSKLAAALGLETAEHPDGYPLVKSGILWVPFLPDMNGAWLIVDAMRERGFRDEHAYYPGFNDAGPCEWEFTTPEEHAEGACAAARAYGPTDADAIVSAALLALEVADD